MQAVDTNIIVRYLVGDDQAQAQKAHDIIGHHSVFISRTVLLETEWVLRGVYDLPAKQIIPALRALLGLPGVVTEDPRFVARALEWAETGMDFADTLHLAATPKGADFLTFDQKFARAATSRTNVPVTGP
jgi:predicted nucleic-acid-binding protein